MTRADLLLELDAWLIRDALERNGGRVKVAARELGLERTSMYKIADRAGVNIEEIRAGIRDSLVPRVPMSNEFRRFLGARVSP